MIFEQIAWPFESLNINIQYIFYISWHGYNLPQTSDISHTLVGNEIVDHSDLVGAAPVAAAPTTSLFLT